MELFKDIRLRIGKNILTRKITRTKRKVYYSNISHVKNIGIVWDASSQDDFLSLTKFHQKMHERNIEVRILGYFPGKNLPDKYTAIRYLTFIRKDELSFFYHPLSAESNTFINRQFDVLIDINFRKIFPLHIISSQSNAALKVGLYESEENDSPYDLMMDIKYPVNIDNYLTQVIQYLDMINSGKSLTVN
jgi:hypothetical protein